MARLEVVSVDDQGVLVSFRLNASELDSLQAACGSAFEARSINRRRKAILKRSLDRMPLCGQAFVVFMHGQGLQDLADLVQCTPSFLLRAPGFAAGKLKAVKRYLSNLGLRLGMSPGEVDEWLHGEDAS